MNTEPSVHLHIERLVIDASLVAPAQRGELQRAVEKQLIQMLSEHGVSSSVTSTAVPAVAAPHFEAHVNSASAQLGKQIASSVYQAIGTLHPHQK